MPLRRRVLDREHEPVAVRRLHAVDPASALGRHQTRAEHDVRDPVAEAGHDAGHDEPARRVRHDDDLPRILAGIPVAASTSASTDATSSPTVSVAKSAGFPLRPGRSTASAGWSRYGNSRSQKRAVEPPPWMSR